MSLCVASRCSVSIDYSTQTLDFSNPKQLWDNTKISQLSISENSKCFYIKTAVSPMYSRLHMIGVNDVESYLGHKCCFSTSRGPVNNKRSSIDGARSDLELLAAAIICGHFLILHRRCHTQLLSEVITGRDDVIKWKHSPRNWPFVWGIHRSPVDSPHKGQWLRALMFSLIRACTDGWVNDRGAGDLRHHRAHYDVTLMVYSLSDETYCCKISPWNRHVWQ